MARSKLAIASEDAGAKIARGSLPEAGTEPPAASLQADYEFLKSVLASSGDCIKVLDLDAKLIFMTDVGQTIMEVDDFNAIWGCFWPDFWQGQGNVDAKAAVAAARAGEVGHFQGHALTMAGTPRYWDVQVTPIRGRDGRPEKLLSVSRDITAQKVAEERQALLHQELAHRVKNSLAMVQAIAAQTLRGDITLAEARDAFTGRLLALANANDILLQASWTEATLRSLVEGTVAVHGAALAERFTLRGPVIRLGPKAALSFALALHELGTNAVKYGALSVPEGRIEIAWEVTADARLSFRWEEIGGPPVVSPTRLGFGSKLINRTIASALRADVGIAYPPTGLVLTVDGPLSAMQETA